MARLQVLKTNKVKKRGSLALFALAFALGVSRTDAQILISEFMAKNDSTLVDGDGNYSDWIELYNSGTESVELTGWYLSDDSDELNQWTFPDTTLEAGEFLVVFASGQDTTGYTDSLGYMHTTFKLSGSEEDVILTQSDGVTIEHSFIDYPDQDDDISYGLAQDSGYTDLIAEEESATALIGTSEPSTSWNTSGFDDSGWLSGETGAGFEDTGSSTTTDWGRPGGFGPGGGFPGQEEETDTEEVYTSMINLDLSNMSGQTDSAYIRVEFTLDGTEDISQLALRMKYDDGFVAYVNGTQVASANAPDSLAYSASAEAEHDGTVYEDFNVFNADDFLQTGENVLAIHGLNYAAEDTADFFMMPVLTGITVGELQTESTMYYSTPTPGGANFSGILGYVADTTFSVDRGFFTNAFEVEISCETEDAAIYYTVDGTTPSSDNGTLYSEAVTIDGTTLLRAIATKTSYQSSDVDTQTYLFLDDIISQGTSVSGLTPEFPSSSVNGQSFDYGMDTDVTESSTYSGEIEDALKAIPSISLVTDPDNLFDSSIGIYVNPEEEGEAWERETSIELINPDGTDGFQINGGIRIRGASSASTSNPKHSFRFFFRSEYGESRLNYDLFGDEGASSFKRMDLRTGQNFSWAFSSPQYATWLYDIFTRDTHREMGQPYTRGEYYHLYINGMYWGLYQTEERCDADFAESYYGGDDDDFDAVKSDADSGDMYAVDGTRDAYDELWTNVTSGVSSDSDYFALQGMNADGSENSSYTKLLDVDNVIDYMLLVYFTANRDSPIGPPNQANMPRNLNAIYNRADPDGIKFVAHDNEHSLEISEGVDHNRFSQSLSSSFDDVDYFTPWWLHLKLMNNDEYALHFADRVHEHFFNGGALTATETAARLEARSEEIYSAVVAESARWGDSAGSLRTRDDDWQDAVDWLLDTYMPYRTNEVLDQIEAQGWYPSVDAPEFSQHGGSIESGFELTISGDSQIYYTLDGTDPREIGGDAIGTAYSSALTLTNTVQIQARSLSGSTWSALTKATFVVDETSALRVTEIMYHPADGGAEFIELQNTGTNTLGLAGTEFTEGIKFDFTEGAVATLDPGEYVVLVENYEAFTNRYDHWADLNIAGEYYGEFYISSGSLDNGGEDIVLVDGLGNTIQDFEYNDWYEITDGDGYSLTLLDPTAETNTWDESSSWRASAYTGGTPGEAPVDFPEPGDLVINEALTHQDDDTPGDWVELYNSSTNSIDINGWFLSDDEEDLTKVELSGLDVIEPGGYLVLTEASHFGLTVSADGFGLSELGETVYLSSGEDRALTGYRIEQGFGASERDVTFGRYTKSDGAVDFVAQSAQTAGATNAYPEVGPLVFSEIMYHPADSNAFEYIELYNASSEDVALYHAEYPENTWKLEGAVEFTFPEDLVLEPGETLLVTPTNAASFSAYYTVDEGVTVLGPYDGKLDNAGEDLWLSRPGDPEADTGEVPDILVEWVAYEDESPWPESADGAGASLERDEALLYANDAENWVASITLSPGSTDYVVVDSDADDDGMLDSWETTYFGGTDAEFGGADEDWDVDGVSNYDEYCAGTDPTDPDSLLEFLSVDYSAGHILTWTSATGKVYSLWWSTNLVSGDFCVTNSAIAATPPMNTYTSEVVATEALFFRLSVEDE